MQVKNLLKTNEDELILSEVLQKSREYLLIHPEKSVNAAQHKRFKNMQKQLTQGLPLAYVLGHKWFYGLKFNVNKHVLIPRPETEQLVEIALQLIKSERQRTIIDIGTGSGAIIVSVARKFAKRQPPKLMATDISKKALQVAKLNAKQLSTRKIVFKQGDLIVPVKKHLTGALIIANLPYLNKRQLKEPSIKHEPKRALFGGKNGLDLIFKLLTTIAKTGKRTAQPITIILEIEPKQSKQLEKWLKLAKFSATIEIKKDYKLLDRFAMIWLN